MNLICSSDVRLQQRAMPVGRVRRETREIFDRMIACMDASCGVGLAAPQVGIMSRLVVMRTPRVLVMADPVILSTSANFDAGEEGCLSFPDIRVHVQRHARVTVRFRDYHNEIRQGDFHGLEAICAQHEIDHLDGITFFARAYQQGISFAGGEQVRAQRATTPSVLHRREV